MLDRWRYATAGRRDLRIDWLRGLAMTCVIVNHSKLPSLLSWFSYERFWVVTAAEVFVVLSGVVLGTVYGLKLVRGDWRAVVRGLSRRALTLYVASLGVTLSVVAIALAGVDVHFLTTSDNPLPGCGWLVDPMSMGPAAWRDVALMRCGPWAFQIVAMYLWLVAAAVPCLAALHFIGWRPLVAASWTLYLWYRIAPHPVTGGEFESTFPLLAWQLLFVHGLAIGYHRERVTALVARCPRFVPLAVGSAVAAFVVFALSNPWMAGPAWLHWSVVSPERFTDLYFQYFGLPDLRIGRLLNLAVALPVGYACLTWGWPIARLFGAVFVTLGQQSLGAFVLHVYGILLVAHMGVPDDDAFWTNTLLQVVLIVAIAALLHGTQRLHLRRPAIAVARSRPVAA
jgi:hypothetical protein